ncbi:MAG: EAL domain-containing protein [Acidimicrobiales bacterium]|jgi:diguanylate cyclase (GGDEF)-like protein/PAS domain S-box-containing protein
MKWPRRREGSDADPGAVLLRVSQTLADATSSYEATLELVARTARSALGGCSLLWLVDDTGRELVLAAAFDADGERLAVVESALRGSRHSLRDPLFAEALLTAGVHVVEPVGWYELGGWADAEAPARLDALGPAALAMVPLRARGTTPGVLGVVTGAAQGELSESEQQLFRQLGDRVAVAIDNARLVRAAEREIEERRRSEEERQAGEATIAAVSRSGPILLFACDAEATIVHLDGGLLTQFQRRPEELVGKSLLQLFQNYPNVLELATRALAGEQIRRAQFPLGSFNLETWATPLRDREGALAGFAGIVVDASARVAAEEAVLEAGRRQAALVEHASDVILVITPDGRVHYANPAAQRVLGYTWRSGDVLDVLSLVHPEDRERCRAEIRQAIKRPGAQDPIEYRMRHANGEYRLIQSIGNNLLDDPAVAGFVITLRDVTEESSASERFRLNAERQAALADLGRWALAGLDYADLVSDAVSVLAEHSPADFVHVFDALPDADFITLSAGHGDTFSASELLSADPTSSPASYALVTQQTVESADLSEEERFDVPELWTRPGAASIIEVPIPGADMPVGVLGVGSTTAAAFSAEDVNFVQAVANVLAAATARNRAETAIRQQALQDPLTGLANRLLLADHVTIANGAAGNLPAMSGAERTVLVLDIDRFKEINDTLGHAIGDLVLLEVARRLRQLGDPVEVVARLGGDEFALVARVAPHDDDRLGGRADEDRLASRVLSVLGEALDVGGVNLRLRGSIGIASADVDREGKPLEVPALLRRAEAAMYQAKAEHQGVRRYSDELERSSLARLALASELAEAIDQGQLRLDYQPKVRCADGGVSGVEALVRWQHPTRGLLLPDVFVPLAEQTGIVRELTSWVLERALAECAHWHRAGHYIPVAVNLSAGTVHDPGLLDAVMTATARAGLQPAAIELEITESAVMRDPAGALRSLEALTSRGVRFALDDFGTGYSSLGYLQRLPVASVKVDKSFVTPLAKGNDSVANAIVRAVVELGHSLNLDVIAEGVDSAIAQSAVTALGCDAMQGFFIAMPMQAQALQPWLAERGARTGTTGTAGLARLPASGAAAAAFGPARSVFGTSELGGRRPGFGGSSGEGDESGPLTG